MPSLLPQNDVPRNPLQSTLPQEHGRRWRNFWASKTRALASAGMSADVGETVALIYRGGELVAAYSQQDTPEDIEAGIADLQAEPLRRLA